MSSIKATVFEAFLGRDAVIRETQKGGKFLSFPVCINIYSNGEDKAQWYDVTWFNFNENIAQHLKKGSCVDFFGNIESEV